MKNQKIKLALIVAAMGVAVKSQAAILTETIVVNPTEIGNSLTFGIGQFDTSLGTLNSVDLILTPNFDFGANVYNISPTPQAVSDAFVSNPQTTLNSAVGLGGTWSSSQRLDVQNFTVDPGTSFKPLPFTLASAPSSVTSVTVGPAGFTGSGTYNLIVGTVNLPVTAGGSGGLPYNGNPSVYYGWDAYIGGSLQVVFNYAAVPEAQSTTAYAGLSALGLVGLASIRRKLVTVE